MIPEFSIPDPGSLFFFHSGSLIQSQKATDPGSRSTTLDKRITKRWGQTLCSNWGKDFQAIRRTRHGETHGKSKLLYNLKVGPNVKESFDGRACTAVGSKMFWNLKRQKLPFLTDRKRNKSGFFYHKLPNHSDKKLLFARNWVTVRFDTPYQGCKTTVSCLLESSYSRSTVPTYSDQGIQISRHSSLQEATCLLYQILALEAVKKITQIQVFEKKITDM
jgi:hypothetical protein